MMETKSPDEWGQQKKVKTWEIAGAKVHNHWVEGDLLTEEQFDTGLLAFLGTPWGAPSE